jgi:uncharacterized protein (TIGR02145 family)
MNYIKQIFLILIALNVFTTYSQKVSNITFKQEQSNIVVFYDLETKTPCKVSLYVSTNGGTSWQGPLKKVTRNVGDKVVSGKHSIVWNVLEEFEELKGDNIKFQVKASGEYIETVVIGNQEWTQRNLDVSKYRNGDIIPEVKDYKKWISLKTGAWCYYNNDPVNGSIYGKLYNWYAVNDPRGLAPEGFHIPSVKEWKDLQSYLNIGYKSDVAGVKLVSNYSPSAQILQNFMYPPDYLDYYKLKDMVNKSGFYGLFGGQRRKYHDELSGFENFDEFGMFWSQSEKINFSISLKYTSNLWEDSTKDEGHSVRCIKD